MEITLQERTRLLDIALAMEFAGRMADRDLLLALASREPQVAMGRDTVSRMHGQEVARHAERATSLAIRLFDLDKMSDEGVASLAQLKGWEVERTTLYDEEGIEGWRWTSPDCKREFTVSGDWSLGPVELSDALRRAIITTLRAMPADT